MMDDEFAFFDADVAINLPAEQFAKYRAVEIFASEAGAHCFNLLNSIPVHQVEALVDERKPLSAVIPVSLETLKATILNPAVPSSSSKKIVCPSVPSCINGKNSFYANEIDFCNIQGKIEKVLSGLNDYDWSFLPDEATWICKYFHGSNIREVHVCSYWDANKSDHLVEVKRVKGDGLFCNKKECVDSLQLLRAAFSNLEGQSLKKGGRLRGPLPLSLPIKSIPSKEQFLQGVQPILKMAGSPNMDSRVEAAKMLCDLAENSDPSLLSLPECQDLCFQALEVLLHDSEERSEEIKQYSLMAFGLLSEHDCYQECFLHFKDFDEIIRLVENAPSTRPSCSCIQMRRQAAKGLSRLVEKAVQSPSLRSAKLSLCKQLQSFGHIDGDHWKRHCDSLADPSLQKYALQVLPCFQ